MVTFRRLIFVVVVDNHCYNIINPIHLCSIFTTGKSLKSGREAEHCS